MGERGCEVREGCSLGRLGGQEGQEGPAQEELLQLGAGCLERLRCRWEQSRAEDELERRSCSIPCPSTLTHATPLLSPSPSLSPVTPSSSLPLSLSSLPPSLLFPSTSLLLLLPSPNPEALPQTRRGATWSPSSVILLQLLRARTCRPEQTGSSSGALLGHPASVRWLSTTERRPPPPAVKLRTSSMTPAVSWKQRCIARVRRRREAALPPDRIAAAASGESFLQPESWRESRRGSRDSSGATSASETAHPWRSRCCVPGKEEQMPRRIAAERGPSYSSGCTPPWPLDSTRRSGAALDTPWSSRLTALKDTASLGLSSFDRIHARTCSSMHQCQRSAERWQRLQEQSKPETIMETSRHAYFAGELGK